jgi:hypothetical protein
MTKKIIIIVVLAAIGCLVAFSQYVHRGYMGVVESGDSLRLLDHGFHLRAPWNKVTIYPTQSREVHLQTFDDGPQGSLHLDAVFLLSVCPDSLPYLHRAYHGAYMERLISPLVVEFLREYGDAYGIWQGDHDNEKVAEAISQRLNSSATHGINVYSVWLRTLEVVADPEISPRL